MTLLSWLVGALTFVGMEGMAWFTHRYVMHGPLWVLHASHHEDDHQRLEWNDLFAVFFAVPAALLIILGAQGVVPFGRPIGFGMTLYGVAYFAMHDILVHRRLGYWGMPKHPYLKRVVREHLLHHATNGERGAYGFLWARDSRPRGND